MKKLKEKWWNEDESKLAECVVSTVSNLRDKQSSRLTSLMVFARLYGSSTFNNENVAGYNYGFRYGDLIEAAEKSSHNVVQQVVDTIHAELIMNRPRPYFLTEDGDWGLQQQAKRLTKFLEGVFYETKIDEVQRAVILDSLIFGTGVVKVFFDERVKVEHVYLENLVVDEQEALYGPIKTIYQIAYCDRFNLIASFPEKKEFLEDVEWTGVDNVAAPDLKETDLVPVIEAWRLPVFKDGEIVQKGKHVIVCQDEVLFDEEHLSPSLPFRFYHWKKPARGFWGTGIPELLIGKQKKLDRLLQNIDDAQELVGSFRVFLPIGASVQKSQLTNAPGSVVEFAGPQPPIFNTAQAVPPELYQEVERQIKRSFDTVGVSELAARAQLPAGLNSGRAIRTYTDNQSKRFIDAIRSFESFHIEIAEEILQTLKANSEKDYSVVYEGKDSIETLNWKEIFSKDISYKLKCFPMSLLPNTPAGKLATLEEMVNSGLIDKQTFTRLADFPDLEAERNLMVAPYEVVQKSLDKMLTTGEYEAPESLIDLNLALKLAKTTYLSNKVKGAPEDRLELIREYMIAVQNLIEQASSPAPGSPPVVSGSPIPPIPQPPTGLPVG